MSFTPENSALKLTTEQEEHVNALVTADEIKSYLASVAAGEQGSAPIVMRDRYSPDVLIPLPTGDPRRAKAYAKILVINGQKHTIEAATEQELLVAENELMCRTFEGQLAVNNDGAQPRDENGRFTRIDDGDPSAKVELELKFKRGEIGADEFLARSGAIDRYLEDTGVPVEEMRQQAFTQKWAKATESFFHFQNSVSPRPNHPSGSGWPTYPPLNLRASCAASWVSAKS